MAPDSLGAAEGASRGIWKCGANTVREKSSPIHRIDFRNAKLDMSF